MAKEEQRQRKGILIDDKYAVVVMQIDYALAKVKTDSIGMYFVPFAFFGTVEKCLREYVKQVVHDVLSVDSIISIGEAERRIAQAISNANNSIQSRFFDYEVVKKG